MVVKDWHIGSVIVLSCSAGSTERSSSAAGRKRAPEGSRVADRERARKAPPPSDARGRLRGERGASASGLASAKQSPEGERRVWCRGPELNWGHPHFQCGALPTELPRHASGASGRTSIITAAAHEPQTPRAWLVLLSATCYFSLVLFLERWYLALACLDIARDSAEADDDIHRRRQAVADPAP